MNFHKVSIHTCAISTWIKTQNITSLQKPPHSPHPPPSHCPSFIPQTTIILTTNITHEFCLLWNILFIQVKHGWPFLFLGLHSLTLSPPVTFNFTPSPVVLPSLITIPPPMLLWQLFHLLTIHFKWCALCSGYLWFVVPAKTSGLPCSHHPSSSGTLTPSGASKNQCSPNSLDSSHSTAFTGQNQLNLNPALHLTCTCPRVECGFRESIHCVERPHWKFKSSDLKLDH